LTKRIWTVPNTKTEAELKIPLSDAALAVLREMEARGTNEPVFPGMNHGESMSNMTIAKVIKQMNKGGPFWVDPKQDNRPIVPHGFRSSFRDWAAEQTNFPNHVVEMALAHAIGDKVEAAYRRGDLFVKRAKLMASWGQYCAQKLPPTVIALRTRS
jgi:integrase